MLISSSERLIIWHRSIETLFFGTASLALLNRSFHIFKAYSYNAIFTINSNLYLSTPEKFWLSHAYIKTASRDVYVFRRASTLFLPSCQQLIVAQCFTIAAFRHNILPTDAFFKQFANWSDLQLVKVTQYYQLKRSQHSLLVIYFIQIRLD